MHLLFYAIMGFFSVVGLVSVAIVISDLLLLKNNQLEDIVVMVKPKKKADNIEYGLKSILLATDRIMTMSGAPEIIVINENMDEDAYNICERVSYDTQRLTVMSKCKFSEEINRRLNIEDNSIL